MPDVTISNVEVRNCRSDAVTLNGHQAPFDATAPLAAGSRLAFIDSLYINGVVGAPGGNGWGLGLQNRFRAGMVSNVYVENAQHRAVPRCVGRSLQRTSFVKGAELALAARQRRVRLRADIRLTIIRPRPERAHMVAMPGGDMAARCNQRHADQCDGELWELLWPAD